LYEQVRFFGLILLVLEFRQQGATPQVPDRKKNVHDDLAP